MKRKYIRYDWRTFVVTLDKNVVVLGKQFYRVTMKYNNDDPNDHFSKLFAKDKDAKKFYNSLASYIDDNRFIKLMKSMDRKPLPKPEPEPRPKKEGFFSRLAGFFIGD